MAASSQGTQDENLASETAEARAAREARELALVGKVELRVALAEQESKLETLLGTYLAPLLLKLGSEFVAVRNKIKLPVTALLKQFKENSKVPLIRHFDLLYVQQGVSRLEAEERADLLPMLIRDFAADAAVSGAHGATLFHLILGSLFVFRWPPKASKEDSELRDKLEIPVHDLSCLSNWLGKLILLRLNPKAVQGSTSCPGLNPQEYSFLTVNGKPEAWDPSAEGGLSIVETKISVLHALGSRLFTASDRIFPALFASADPNSRLSDLGNELLKRTIADLDLEDSALVERLYNAYFGRELDVLPDATLATTPLRLPIKMKILDLLSRINCSAAFPAQIIQIIQQGLSGDSMTAEDGPVQGPNREAAKFRAQVVSFVHFVTRKASSATLDILSQTLIQELRSFVNRNEDEVHLYDGKSLRGRCFEAIGLLSAASRRSLVEDELSVMRWLFEQLSKENAKEVVVSIDDALSSILGSFQYFPDLEFPETLQQLLLENIHRESINSRNIQYAVVRFANRCLPYKDVIARWIDLTLIAGGSVGSHEITEEATKGLDPYWYQLQRETTQDKSRKSESIDLPHLPDLVNYIFGRQLDSDVRSHAVTYSRRTLLCSALVNAGSPLEFTADWVRKLDVAVASDPKTREAIKSYLTAALDDFALLQATYTLWNASLHGMLEENTKDRLECGEVFLELCSLSPLSLRAKMIDKVELLQQVIFSNDASLQALAARSYGVLSSQAGVPIDQSQSSYTALMEKLASWKIAIGAEANKAEGSLLALAYSLSRKLYQDRDDQNIQALLFQYLTLLCDILDRATGARINDAAYSSLSQLCVYQVVSADELGKQCDLTKTTDRIVAQSKAGNERAIAALGYLSMIFDEHNDAESLKNITEYIYSLHELRQAESQFTVGEALCCLTCGWDCSTLSISFDLEGPLPKSKSRESTFPAVITHILDSCASTKPALKKASVIWLLCMLQFCGHKKEVQSHLPQFQAAFKRCLSDRDELVQESASRGLGLVYERGNRDLKDDLIKDLVSSFSSNRTNMSGTVSEDTQLFEPGALPTGDGSITTYKDIMSLASEVGDSSLVYKFMSLASNNAIWSSRAAFGRFGLSSVLSDSSVDGYLAANPKLYPKLFRYRFDSNTNVRKSMNDIWNALVKDSAGTVDTHFDAIMQDLLVNIISREWRVRQACCAAIADLVQGQELNKFQQYLDQIWNLCFKVLDDIKSSVRTAAAALARVLTNILLRTLETSTGESQTAASTLRSVLPFLFSTSGLESSSKEVQALSLHTLLEIIKKGNTRTLRPFVAGIVEQLLGMLSTFEPEAVNYVYLNAAKYNLTERKIDDLRLASVRSSPLMEAIERCLEHLDEDSMAELSGRLQSAMKSAVGMPSKVGCSRVLVTLSTRHNFVFKPYAGRFLRALEKCVADKNETVSASYAAAMGYVARGATDPQVLSLADFCQRLYFNAEEDRVRVAAGDIVLSVSKYATDRFKALATNFLPFVFFVRHDDNEQVQKLFAETWSEMVGGPRAASLYLTEILKLASSQLDSPRWVLKHAAALTVAEVITAIAASKGEIDEIDGELIWPHLVKAMAEKTWDGKEQVLEAFVTFVEKAPKFMATSTKYRAEIAKIAVREAKRRNAAYQEVAVPRLARVARVLHDQDMSEAAYGIAASIIDDTEIQSDAGSGSSTQASAGGGRAAGAAGDSIMGNTIESVREDKRRETLMNGAVECVLCSINVRAIPDEQVLAGRLNKALALVARANADITYPGVSAAAAQFLRQFLDNDLRGATGPTPVPATVLASLDLQTQSANRGGTPGDGETLGHRSHSTGDIDQHPRRNMENDDAVPTTAAAMATVATSSSPSHALEPDDAHRPRSSAAPTLAQLLLVGPNNPLKPEQARLDRSAAILALAKVLALPAVAVQPHGIRRDAFLATLRQVLERETAPTVRKNLDRAYSILLGP